jgi:hypothetical protein
MVSAKTADKLQLRRPSASKQMKRLLHVLSTTPTPAPRAQGPKKPDYLRYIEYV